MLTTRDIGHRVSVRRRTPEGLSDLLGHLLDIDDRQLEVLGRGAVHTIARADVTAAKVVPPATPRRGWEVPLVAPDDMQRICWAGWPARETERLGDWVLRAHGGITGRANSAMAVGDPGLPVPGALRRTADWYAARELPPLLQLPLADSANLEMDAAGWPRLHVTVVQVAPIARVLSVLSPVGGSPTTESRITDGMATSTVSTLVEPNPSADWRSLMHDLDADVETHLAILTGPAAVGFVTVRRGAQPVGIGRVSVEGTWCGITSVDVAPGARRQGVGSAVMRGLLSWAADQGATSSYLQVRAGNAGALLLYDALGYVTHHPYGYRAPIA